MGMIGYNTIGANVLNYATNFGSTLLKGRPFTPTQDETVTSIEIHGRGSSSAGTLVVGVYDITTGVANETLVGKGTLSFTTATQWHVLSGLSFSLTSGRTYAVAFSAPTGTAFTLSRDSESEASNDLRNGTTGDLDSTYGTEVNGNLLASIFATTEAAASVPDAPTGSTNYINNNGQINPESDLSGLTIAAGDVLVISDTSPAGNAVSVTGDWIVTLGGTYNTDQVVSYSVLDASNGYAALYTGTITFSADGTVQIIVSPAEPKRQWLEVTPSNDDDLSRGQSFRIFVGTAGTVTYVDSEGEDIQVNLPIGYAPIRTARIKDTGTSASGIFAIYK